MKIIKFVIISILLFSLISCYVTREALNAQNEPNVSGKQSIKLLVRTDDMGNDYGRNLGIIKAHKEGIVTTVSLMPSSVYFEEAVQWLKSNPTLAVGLHITLLGTRVRPVLSPDLIPSIVTPLGFFYETIDQLENANPKVEEMEKEIRAQVGKVNASGLHFVSIEAHRSLPEPASEIIAKICDEQRVLNGLRDLNGLFYGYKRVTGAMGESWPTLQAPDGEIMHYAAPAFNKEQEQSFLNVLNDLKPGKWIIVVHPGIGEPQRTSVTELLCSPKVKEIIKMKNIQLVSSNNIWEEEFGETNSR